VGRHPPVPGDTAAPLIARVCISESVPSARGYRRAEGGEQERRSSIPSARGYRQCPVTARVRLPVHPQRPGIPPPPGRPRRPPEGPSPAPGDTADADFYWLPEGVSVPNARGYREVVDWEAADDTVPPQRPGIPRWTPTPCGRTQCPSPAPGDPAWPALEDVVSEASVPDARGSRLPGPLDPGGEAVRPQRPEIPPATSLGNRMRVGSVPNTRGYRQVVDQQAADDPVRPQSPGIPPTRRTFAGSVACPSPVPRDTAILDT